MMSVLSRRTRPNYFYIGINRGQTGRSLIVLPNQAMEVPGGRHFFRSFGAGSIFILTTHGLRPFGRLMAS
jgi:hypothetical protein